jgi:hypothetical protein
MPRQGKFVVGDVVYVDRSQVAPSLAKDLFWRVFVDPAVIRKIEKGTGRYGVDRIEVEFPFGKKYWFDSDAIELKNTPKRKAKRKNPGTGKAFTFHGSFKSKILAARREREIPGSFIQEKDGRYYVLKPKRIRSKVSTNPKRGVLIYGRVLKVFAQKTAGPFKGQRFVHTFKPGALMYGLPDGSLRITHP